jgi:hypothetical protein
LDDARNGVNLENRLKRVRNALEAIDSNKKRYTAGLHAAAGRFILGPEVLQIVSRTQAETQSKYKVRKGSKTSKHCKKRVQQYRELGKPDNELNVTQLWTMVSWYKRPSDQPAPITRQLLLTSILNGNIWAK